MSLTAPAATEPSSSDQQLRWLIAPLFFASGFAALIYQVVWQRSLTTMFGTNSESVSAVVASFMLGLGRGSLAGGALSRREALSPLVLFGACEVAVGLYGFVSLSLFHAVGEATLGAAPLVAGSIAFALLLVPTLLMGATLPLLLAWSVSRSRSVGRSISVLYFVNTLGSAAASVCAALVLLPYLGQARAVTAAASTNLATGLVVLFLARRWRSR